MSGISRDCHAVFLGGQNVLGLLAHHELHIPIWFDTLGPDRA